MTWALRSFLVLCISVALLSAAPSVPLAEGDQKPAEEKEEKKKEKAANKKSKKADGKEVAEDKKPEYDREYSVLERIPQGIDQPWRIVRALQNAQDRIVHGEEDAIRGYQILLLRSGKWMHELDRTAWQYERNLDALGIYMLLGGDVQLGYKALRKTMLGYPQKVLLMGALAYAERQNGTAYQLLSRVNHRTLPASIAGQVAITKSMLYSSYDLQKSYQLLHDARLLAPGTLVEEAALRRSIRVALELKKFEDVKNLQRAYLNRFSDSWYFSDFLRNISFALLAAPIEHKAEILPEFQYLIDRIPEDKKLQVAEYVSRRAILKGLFDVATWTSEFGLTHAEKGSKLATRMQLYAAASDVSNKDKVAGIVELTDSINTAHLSEPDLKIFEAIRIVSKGITRPPKEEALALLKSSQTEDQSYEAAIAQTDDKNPYALTDEQRAQYIKKVRQNSRMRRLRSKFDKVMEGTAQ